MKLYKKYSLFIIATLLIITIVSISLGIPQKFISLAKVYYYTISVNDSGFRYQRIVKDKDGRALQNQKIVLKIEILQNNKQLIFSETHHTRTNNFGLIDIQIGQGEVIKGEINKVKWGSADQYLKIYLESPGNTIEPNIYDIKLPSFYNKNNTQKILNETQHTGKSSPHTLCVVRPNSTGKYKGHTYWGYVGEQKNGNIDLRFSEDLHNWQSFAGNPIIEGNKARWPSVLFEDGKFYMAHTINYGQDASIVLEKSHDGINFYKVANLTSSITNQDRNPFLFKDPVTKKYYLFYKRYVNHKNEIRVKESATIEGLYNTNSIVLLERRKGTIAAPAMFYANGLYWLLAESGGMPWAIEAYASAKPTGPFIENPAGWILSNDDGCPFPYVERDTLYLYVCHRDDSIWKVNLATFDTAMLDNNR